jgi:16S rRNA pseudouridine516 synthase
MERLDKRLADTGQWSRKEARELIRAGRVTVDETVCRAPEQKVAEDQPVRVDGNLLGEGGAVYLMLHKPAGVVSATEDAREQTVLSLLPEPYQRMGLFPVGRLDKDTEGLLLLTNDGALAHRLLSPRHHVDKVYYLEVDGLLDETDVQAAAQGITLADGYTCLPAKLEPLESGSAGHLTIQEGKYHQVKRMMASRGKPVTYLKRVGFGPLKLEPELGKSCWRTLTEEEKNLLFRH